KNFFGFTERNTSYKQEVFAGLTTFLSVSYILVVNPLILSQAGMDRGAVFTATALTAIIGTLLIGLLANYPIAIAPSM
ncbi:solute carrier family 23 protein, partial [Staphylococcus sp. SIMBA_130]